jgi:hypothetical protein
MTIEKFICLCGYMANGKTASAHTRQCRLYIDEKQRISEYIDINGKELYIKTYSVTHCVEIISSYTTLSMNIIRKIFVDRMKPLNILEGVSGINQQAMKQSKIRKTTFDRYGVINIGQKTGGWTESNNIPYEKLSLMSDLSIYRDQVNNLTWKYFINLKRTHTIPSECHYTGITFNDNLLERVNPNDPYKRTMDHITPVTEAFFKGWSPEKTSEKNNIVFCLRVINTLKSNTNYNDFVINYLPHIIEKLNESKISN